MDVGIPGCTVVDDGLRQLLDTNDICNKFNANNKVMGYIFCFRDLLWRVDAHVAIVVHRTVFNIYHWVSHRFIYRAICSKQNLTNCITCYLRNSILDLFSNQGAGMASYVRERGCHQYLVTKNRRYF